jgi:predicted ATP-grasp superfamily ATP-dependent carboligase
MRGATVERALRAVAGGQPVAVVLGLGQNGMATCRALGRTGIPVIGVDTDLEQPGARTRYGVKVRCADFLRGGPGLVDCLEAVGRGLERKGVLLPSGDLNLAIVSEHRERLAPHFHIALPPKDVVRMFLDKKVFYQFAMTHGFPIAPTFFPSDASDLERVAGQVAYPCLIKPFQPNAVWRRTFDTRLFIADSPDTLRSLYGHLVQVHQDLIVQEYMPGPDSELYWGVTYLDATGQPLAVWTGRKLRQYPRRFGTATLAESRWEPWVAREATAVLGAMGHRGYGVVEFKRDRRDGRFKITEATGGRTWFPHSLVTRSGINLPLIWYRDALGLDPEVPAAYEEGIRWIHEERDLKTVLLYFLPEGELSLRSWLGSYRGKRAYAYAAWDDPAPLLAALGRMARSGWRRLARRLSTAHPERARHAGKKPRHMEELLLAADPTVGRSLRRVDFQ